MRIRFQQSYFKCALLFYWRTAGFSFAETCNWPSTFCSKIFSERLQRLEKAKKTCREALQALQLCWSAVLTNQWTGLFLSFQKLNRNSSERRNDFVQQSTQIITITVTKCTEPSTHHIHRDNTAVSFLTMWSTTRTLHYIPLVQGQGSHDKSKGSQDQLLLSAYCETLEKLFFEYGGSFLTLITHKTSFVWSVRPCPTAVFSDPIYCKTTSYHVA